MRAKIMAVIAALLLSGYAALAAPRGLPAPPKIDAYVQCLHSLKWCWQDITEPITKETQSTATLWSSEKLWLHRQNLPMALRIACWNGQTLTILGSTFGTISFLSLDIDYRVDPEGTVGRETAEHVREGSAFGLSGDFPNVIRNGEKLTMRITTRGDGASGVVTFKIKGAGDVLDRLNCAKAGR